MSEAKPVEKPERWLAVLLAIPWPGLGFAYLGRGWISLMVFAALIGCWLCVMVAVLAGCFTFAVLALACAASVVIWLAAVIGTFFAGRRPHWSPRPIYSRWYGLLAIVAASAVWGLVMPMPIEAFSVPAGSMMPALMPGDRFISVHWDQLDRMPRRGEIVVVRLRKQRADYVKRVIGLPGDMVQLTNNVVIVNGSPWLQKSLGDFVNSGSDSFLSRTKVFEETSADGLTYRVLYDTARSRYGIDHDGVRRAPWPYFLLGDNRDNSHDSRFADIGVVPIEDLRALPLFLYYSPNLQRIGEEVR